MLQKMQANLKCVDGIRIFMEVIRDKSCERARKTEWRNLKEKARWNFIEGGK